MQQGTEGTERFCIKQLLKPIDNVGCPGDLCMALLSGDLLHIVAISQAVVYMMLLDIVSKQLCLYCSWQQHDSMILCCHGMSVVFVWKQNQSRYLC